MQFLSTEDVIELHSQLIKRFGGLHGIRDMHLLESAIAYPKLLHTIAQEKDPYLLAAAYALHLINNLPSANYRKGATNTPSTLSAPKQSGCFCCL